MGPAETTLARTLLEYDALRRRLWISGQRCHHGATGSVVATLACLGLMLESAPAMPLAAGARLNLALALAGGALMAHDWKDREMWFERGRGSQP
jgi:hypothetical protein